MLFTFNTKNRAKYANLPPTYIPFDFTEYLLLLNDDEYHLLFFLPPVFFGCFFDWEIEVNVYANHFASVWTLVTLAVTFEFEIYCGYIGYDSLIPEDII